MRDALRKSDADATHRKTRLEAGSIVICNGCAKPLFVLERALSIGDKAGRAADAFAPVTRDVLAAMAVSTFVDPGLQAWAAHLTSEEATAHCDAIQRPKSGDPMQCPFCHGAWPQILTAEVSDTLDRAYTIEIVAVSLGHLSPAIRGRKIGTGAGWVH